MSIRYSTVSSPIGSLVVAKDDAGICALRFGTEDAPAAPDASWVRDDAALDDARHQLQEYFAGKRRDFTLPLSLHSRGFSAQVHAALREIPYGKTITYGELAGFLGSPGAARAVGQANGKNPLPVLIPCHRVVAAGGALGGFTGGLEVKRYLLRHEGALAPRLC